jgi:hypothetical protein
MSILELDKLNSEELIAQFIIESKEKGFFLSYSDYELISIWLKVADKDPDTVLLVLSEILPNYMAKNKERSGKCSLKGINHSVLKAIVDVQRKM